MSKVKRILELKRKGFSYREIASSVGCGKAVVGDTLKRAVEAGIDAEDNYSEEELEKLLFPYKPKVRRGLDEENIGSLLTELGKKHMTRQLLWEKYKEENPDRLMYSQFCEVIKQAKKENSISFTKTYKGGEICEVDWAGTKIPYYSSRDQRRAEASIFVAVLPASNYPFIYACPNQGIECWIDAHIRAFDFYGGTPRILVPDNTKTAVTKSDLFSPIIAKSYEEMGRHYGIEIIPTRVCKARDKASVENTVGNISRRIIVQLLERRFTRIEEINLAIKDLMEKFVEHPFKKMKGSRRSAFEEIDKPALRPLPSAAYELAHFKSGKLGPNYHIEYENYFYSVPYEYRGKICDIRATKSTIEVYISGKRVCCHQRQWLQRQRYVTNPQHMPDNHKAMSDNQLYLDQAAAYGEKTVAYLKAVQGNSVYYVHSYRACMGILREAKGIEKEIIEAASEEALKKGLLTCSYFTVILKKKRQEMQHIKPVKVIEHDNIRGAIAFKGAMENA